MSQQAAREESSGDAQTTSATTGGTSSSGGSGAGVRSFVRGMSYDDGAAALMPVQRKTSGAGGLGGAGGVGGASKAGAKPGGTKPAGSSKPVGAVGGTSQDRNTGSKGEGKALDPIEKPRIASVSEEKMGSFTEDLGQVDSMSAAQQAIGAALELFAPRPGTSAEVALDVKIFAIGLYAGLKLKGGVKCTEAGFELSGSMAVSVGVGIAAGPTKAWAGLEGMVGFNAKGDSGAECMDLVGLGIYTWMCNQEITLYDAIFSPVLTILKATGGMGWLADQVFGEGFDEAVLKQMDPNSAGDEADTLLFEQQLGLDAGAEAEAGTGPAKVGAGVGFNIGGGTKTTYGKSDDGKLEETTQSGIAGSIGLDLAIGGLSLSGGCAFWKPSDGPAEVELSVEIGLPGGPLSLLATTIWDAWGGAIGGSIAGISDERLREQIELGALTTPRAGVMAALEACHFAHAGIEFVFTISGAEREFAVELVKKAEFDVTAGAGIAGASVDVSATTKSEIYHHHWTVGAGAEH